MAAALRPALRLRQQLRPRARSKGGGGTTEDRAPPLTVPRDGVERSWAGTDIRRTPRGGGRWGGIGRGHSNLRGFRDRGAPPPAVGSAACSRAFFSPASRRSFSRLLLLVQPCPALRPPCSRPPARGRRAQRPGSPPLGSASPSCPRMPALHPRALHGPRATTCTGEGGAAPRQFQIKRACFISLSN